MSAGEQQREQLEAHKKEFEPLTRWLGEKLGAWVTRAAVSRRLARSPAALAATAFGWTGNMERLALSNAHQKADDAQRRHHLSQKKMLEINPRHPMIVELLRRVRDDPDSREALEAAHTLYRTAAVRCARPSLARGLLVRKLLTMTHHLFDRILGFLWICL